MARPVFLVAVAVQLRRRVVRVRHDDRLLETDRAVGDQDPGHHGLDDHDYVPESRVVFEARPVGG